jgi:hypothetical protein
VFVGIGVACAQCRPMHVPVGRSLECCRAPWPFPWRPMHLHTTRHARTHAVVCQYKRHTVTTARAPGVPVATWWPSPRLPLWIMIHTWPQRLSGSEATAHAHNTDRHTDRHTERKTERTDTHTHTHRCKWKIPRHTGVVRRESHTRAKPARSHYAQTWPMRSMPILLAARWSKISSTTCTSA